MVWKAILLLPQCWNFAPGKGTITMKGNAHDCFAVLKVQFSKMVLRGIQGMTCLMLPADTLKDKGNSTGC
jgi:hypothetical protein